MQRSLLRLSFRLNMYQTGTEADWIPLDLVKLHSKDSQDLKKRSCPGPTCHEDVFFPLRKSERAILSAAVAHVQEDRFALVYSSQLLMQVKMSRISPMF